ncbi:malto-oligosyltrehalose trehalohydrolase [Almyronema epifaneia]|uniref:Malto-oligosyltrehalose trehalohydrolase n=1 Tax=Almyronema epifaneia S1 TaxID=2991925 RepID=A0ABW6IEV2_9CYAN
MNVGAHYLGDRRCQFTVWAPFAKDVAVQFPAQSREVALVREGEYWQAIVADVPPETLYLFRLDQAEAYPDPASQYQPKDVHGPSAVVDHNFDWQCSQWSGLPLASLIIYELHVGTFTPEGTFSAIIPRLPELADLGINAIELMPVAQFPGDRNWGYDGVYPFAVQHSYGGPTALKQLVDACHQHGIAVVMDVVYNHFGPEGNYTSQFAPYFTEKYRTPWGSAINFDEAYSEGVRNYVRQNALYWLQAYHIDALRLDAIHAIYDFGAKHILQDLAEAVAEFNQQHNRRCYLIAESDLNDGRVLRPASQGGYGVDAQWSDDFHHALHTLLTHQNQGYYRDFGTCQQFAKALEKSFVYTWDYSPFRQRRHGNDVSDRPPYEFVVCSQNHDQIGNQMLGERLSQLVSFDQLKLAAGAVLLSPYLPMLFMGEEYGEKAPFVYFVSHSDPDLLAAIRQGRAKEFAHFHAEGEPPEAAAVETFKSCHLHWAEREEGAHGTLLAFYKRLIQLRQQLPALQLGDRRDFEAFYQESDRLVGLHHWHNQQAALCLFNFGEETVTYSLEQPGSWQKCLDSNDPQWQGPGAIAAEQVSQAQTVSLLPHSLVLYEKLT